MWTTLYMISTAIPCSLKYYIYYKLIFNDHCMHYKFIGVQYYDRPGPDGCYRHVIFVS